MRLRTPCHCSVVNRMSLFSGRKSQSCSRNLALFRVRNRFFCLGFMWNSSGPRDYFRDRRLPRSKVVPLPSTSFPIHYSLIISYASKGKGIPRQAEVDLGVPSRLRPRIFSTFGTTRVAGRQPNAPAAFTPGEIPGTHFQRLSRAQGTWFCRKEPRKKSEVTPPVIDPGTVRLVAQRLNHYATPVMRCCIIRAKRKKRIVN
jgi:hypothetical protein